MKNLVVCILLLTGLAGNGQNRLTDLCSLNPGDKYPTNMPYVKEWINMVLGKVFVRNLQFSDNTASSSKFIMFNPVASQSSAWLLGSNGVKIIPNNSTISANYEQNIYNYLRQFDIAKFDYKPHSYFVVAKDIMRINDNEMLANTFNFFIEPSINDNIFKTFIDIINKKKQSKLAYISNETISALSKALNVKYPGGIVDIIYDCFIVNKDQEKTIRKIDRFYEVTGFFPEGVQHRVNELINPKIQFKQDRPFLVEIPAHTLKLSNAPDSTARFFAKTGTVILNYQKKALEISLQGELNGRAAPESLKSISYVNGKQVLTQLQPTTPPQVIKQLDITIAEKLMRLTTTSADFDIYMLVEEPWKRQ